MNSFNDGVLYAYKRKAQLNSYKSINNTKKLEDLELLNAFFFHLETQRQQDILFAGARDRTLTKKVIIPLFTEEIRSDYLIVIDDYLYSIIHVDPDKGKNQTYIYLEGMREIEG